MAGANPPPLLGQSAPSSVPAENWDDDFEFSQSGMGESPKSTRSGGTRRRRDGLQRFSGLSGFSSGAGNPPGASSSPSPSKVSRRQQISAAGGETRMSTASSSLTEDWDAYVDGDGDAGAGLAAAMQLMDAHMGAIREGGGGEDGTLSVEPLPVSLPLPSSSTQGQAPGQSPSTSPSMRDRPPAATAHHHHHPAQRSLSHPLELMNWAEAGPSTPSKDRSPHTPHSAGKVPAAPENWDDFFEGPQRPDPPATPGGSSTATAAALGPQQQHQRHPSARALKTRHSYHTPPRPRPGAATAHLHSTGAGHAAGSGGGIAVETEPEPEDWSEDFESAHGTPRRPGAHGRRATYDQSSDEEDFGFGLADGEHDREEDKTVTARNRPALALHASSTTSASSSSARPSPPPPVPALPSFLHTIEPFPRSPTVSVFSVPSTSGRNSVAGYAYGGSSSHYGSTSALALRPTLSNSSYAHSHHAAARSLAGFPPSPPVAAAGASSSAQRERRRLRKKSRPPHMGEGVFELIEEPLGYGYQPMARPRDPGGLGLGMGTSPPGAGAVVPVTPPRASEPALVPQPAHQHQSETSVGAVVGSPSSGAGIKSPLLARIGSVKKWGAARRKRASMGPGELPNHDFTQPLPSGGTTYPPSSSSTYPPRPASSAGMNMNEETTEKRGDKGAEKGNSSGGGGGWFFRTGGGHGSAYPPPAHNHDPGRAANIDIDNHTTTTTTTTNSNDSNSNLNNRNTSQGNGQLHPVASMDRVRGASGASGASGSSGVSSVAPPSTYYSRVSSSTSGHGHASAEGQGGAPSTPSRRRKSGLFSRRRGGDEERERDPEPVRGKGPTEGAGEGEGEGRGEESDTGRTPRNVRPKTKMKPALGLGGAPRRPSSMQVPPPPPPHQGQSQGQGHPYVYGGGCVRAPSSTRHASYGSSVGRAASRIFGAESVESIPEHGYGHGWGGFRSRSRSPAPPIPVFPQTQELDEETGKARERARAKEAVVEAMEGRRGLMGSLRRISLGGSSKKHKSKKSVADLQYQERTESTQDLHAGPGHQGHQDRGGPEQRRERERAQQDDHDQQTPKRPSVSASRKSAESQAQLRAGHGSTGEPSLLPPIELQPPSPPLPPPRRRGIETARPRTAGSINLSASPHIDSLVLPREASSSTVTASSATPTRLSPRSSAFRANRGASPAAVKAAAANSPQSASLGRAATPAGVAAAVAYSGNGSGGEGGASSTSFPRRNSLGDLKIPARISQAQMNLKRDLTMVREFAASVEKLKELQSTYQSLVFELQALLESAPPSRATSPTFSVRLSIIPGSGQRGRSSTNPQDPQRIVNAFHAISARYSVTWECAELLIELGGGPPASADMSSPSPSALPSPPPPQQQSANATAVTMSPASVASAPAMRGGDVGMSPSDMRRANRERERERAVTLESSKQPPSGAAGADPAWRASTGRNDLSQRQLFLLRDMLSTSPDAHGGGPIDEAPVIPEEPPASASSYGSPIERSAAGNGYRNTSGRASRQSLLWRWGDEGMGRSTTTLPSEDASQASADGRQQPRSQKRSGRLGMAGLRDLLRSLKKSTAEQAQAQAQAQAQVRASMPPPQHHVRMQHSAVSLSENSSVDSHFPRLAQGLPAPNSTPAHMVQRRRAKTSSGPESSARDRDREYASAREGHQQQQPQTSPYTPTSYKQHKSPRRPSLASIFRMGQKQKASPSSNAAGGNSSTSGAESAASMGSSARADSRASRYSIGGGGGGAEDYEFDSDDEDWDHVEDLDAAARALGVEGGATTIKSKKKRSPYLLGVTGGFSAARAEDPSVRPVTPKNQLTGSSTSLGPGIGEASSPRSVRPMRSTRLSNVEEVADRNSADAGALVPMTSTPQLRTKSGSRRGSSPSRPPSRGPGQSYGRSGSVRSGFDQPLPDIKLAMTPENIKPLLENAREVHIRLNECIKEVRLLIDANAAPFGGVAQEQQGLPSSQ